MLLLRGRAFGVNTKPRFSLPAPLALINTKYTLSNRPSHHERFHMACKAVATVETDGEVMKASDEGRGCSIPHITVNNKAHPSLTKIEVQIPDYPGLFRVISWVLNGLHVRVHSMVLRTEDNMAMDTFWLEDRRGRKLSDATAEALVDQLFDYLVMCDPNKDEQRSDKTFQSGNIQLCNSSHPQFTQVTMVGEPRRPGFLSEIASVLTGVGCVIHQSVVQGAQDGPVSVAQHSHEVAGDGADNCGALDEVNHDFAAAGRLFRFWVTDKAGEKLDYSSMSALVFTLNLIAGKGHMPTVPPNKELF